MSYCKLYKGTPTVGAQDGTEVSQDGAQTSPIQTLTILAGELGTVLTCAIRIPDQLGIAYKSDTATPVTITPYPQTGTYTKWRLSLSPSGFDTKDDTDPTAVPEWGAALSFTTTEINNANVLFYVQASAGSAETPVNDITISMQTYAIVVAVN